MEPGSYFPAILGFTTGLTLSIAGAILLHRWRKRSYRRLAATVLAKAEEDAKELRQKCEVAAREDRALQQQEMESRWAKESSLLARKEKALQQKEEKLERRMSLMEQKITELDQRAHELKHKSRDIDEAASKLAQGEASLKAAISRLAEMTPEQARQEVLRSTEELVRGDSAKLTQRILSEAQEEAECRVRKILATTIQRLAVPCVSEVAITTVSLPSDDFKGRIIGREGRNIRALERATGVTIIVDETPGAIIISGFDPVRKEVARLALSELVLDGRIHPTRIEEAVEKAQLAVQERIRAYGEEAATRAGCMDLHPQLLTLLGQLKFRYSYRQNVLEHSIEVSHIMGIMAAELGLNERLAKRIGLLHDMGKALSHECGGSHALIGYDEALKCGESEEVANGIGCHHGEMDPITIEGSLCGAADAISGARPGARVEAVEEYVQRVRTLEDLARGFPGVDSVYALQAGRELRVCVLPEMIDDAGCINLARDLTKKIKTSISYPGKIKVTVIREKRAVEYAV